MKTTYSPLRYPGGKSKISPLIKIIINKLKVPTITYIEPFAGGAGVALDLLLSNCVDKIIINDYDKAIYSFWRAIKESPEQIKELILSTPVNILEWKKQKEIYKNCSKSYSVELAFSALYLNRTNRSGILTAGPIGGYSQNGNYKIDSRFNKYSLVEKINAICKHKDKIKVFNKEIRSFIKNILPHYSERSFIYFDPPYYINGQRLYKNSLTHEDHKEIAYQIINYVKSPWVITYDNNTQISNIYSNFIQRKYQLNYSVALKTKGTELLILKNYDLLPCKDELYDYPQCGLFL